MIGSAIKPAELNNNSNPLDSQKDEKSEGASQPVKHKKVASGETIKVGGDEAMISAEKIEIWNSNVQDKWECDMNLSKYRTLWLNKIT